MDASLQNSGGEGSMNESPPAIAAPVSMTGYARATGLWQGYCWAWELRSVNGKGLDIRLRLPSGCDGLEALIRAAASRACRRGSLTVALDLRQESAAPALMLNRAMLEQVLALHAELGQVVDRAPPRLEALLALRGMIDAGDRSPPSSLFIEGELAGKLLASLKEGVAALADMRRSEGGRLSSIVSGQLDEIERLVAQARLIAARQPDVTFERLRRQLASLLDGTAGIPEERVAQEAALLAARADVTEELDRLSAHLAAARELLAKGNAAGRPLDFLAQEFNREANTLTSKASDIDLTRAGIALKTAIDQFREQIQNIE